MAVKPLTMPAEWASNTNYTTGPFIGLPTKSGPPPIAPDGHRPGSAFPTAAEYENYQSHWVTRWVRDWLAQGLAVASPDTHIVETNSAGRTELIGLDLTDIVDRRLGTWTAANTIVPAIDLTTAGGRGFEVDTTAGVGTCYAAIVGNGSGFGAFGGPASAGAGFIAVLQGTGAVGQMLGLGLNTQGLSISTINRTPLIATCSGNASSIRLPPKAPPAAPVAGDMVIDSFAGPLTFWDAGATQQRVFSSEFGLIRIIFGAYTNLINVPLPQSPINQVLNFEGGKQYDIRTCCTFGRPVGSTAYPQILLTIGGVHVAWSPRPFQVEVNNATLNGVTFTMDATFTPGVTGGLAVQLTYSLFSGAGNIHRGPCSVAIVGVFD